MTQKEFTEIDSYMQTQMRDSAHDKHHVYRVLGAALEILRQEALGDADVLIAACLLHDIGRERQFADPSLCHAQAGSEMAREYLLSRGWSREKAEHVKECVASHSYRGGNPPQSLEAKILFDADKLDASGAMGIARTLIYHGQAGEPLYLLDENHQILLEGSGEEPSFFQEYQYKLKEVYDAFYTERGKAIAQARRKAAEDFYLALSQEITQSYGLGMNRLEELLGS